MLRIEHEDDGRIELWTVDRPSAANALDAATLAMLEDAIDSAEGRLARGDLLRGIVLCGAPRPGAARQVFLSGADLREVEAVAKGADDVAARAFAARVLQLLSRLEQLGTLVIAAISGDVYGGGCEVVTACDLRIGEATTQLAFRQTRIGVASGWGGTTRLARLVGLGSAKRLLLTGMPCDSAEALRIGLLDEVVAPGEARTRAIEIVRAASVGAPGAIAAMKRGLLEALDLPREASLSRELDRFVQTWRSDDHREALTAMREKRPPRWQK
jgi:enoyl-CoA hydratase/carnithine racemase